MKKNILMVSPYDIQNPLHGGQRRVRAMFDFLSRHHQVTFLSVTEKPVKTTQKNIYNLSYRNKIRSPKTLTILEDYRQMKFLMESDYCKDQLNSYLKGRHFDCIQFEHPWLFPLFRNALDLTNYQIVYSSHNVEFKLKEDILESYQPKFNLLEAYHGSGITDVSFEMVREIVNDIEGVEVDLVKKSDFVIAVSESDITKYKEYNPKSVVLVRNCPGVSAQPVPTESKGAVCAFVGSGHQPNVNGFLEMMGDMLGYLAPEEKVHLLGEVSVAIQMDTRFIEFYSLNISRIKSFFPLKDADLAKQLSESRCIILPIRDGGGSNLKTAEALLVGRPIVATSKAFRGFDEFVSEKEIYIEDDPKQFRKRVIEILRRTESSFVVRDQKKLAQLSWDYQIGLIGNKY